MKGKNYRIPKGQPYVRNEYIGGTPASKIVKFVMGNAGESYNYRIALRTMQNVQIRHNALEAARVSANKNLSDLLGQTDYMLKIRVYPHVILRENKMLATAGADRLQEGMRRSFGKPIGRAARVRADDAIIEIYTNENGIEAAKKALNICSSKIPTPCKVTIEKLEAKAI